MKDLITVIQGMIAEEFSAISMADALLAIGLSFVLGLFVVLIYKVTYGGVCFSKSFAGCLIILSMVTALVILVIASDVVRFPSSVSAPRSKNPPTRPLHFGPSPPVLYAAQAIPSSLV